MFAAVLAIFVSVSAQAGSILLPDKPVSHEARVVKPVRGPISPIDFQEIATDQMHDFAAQLPDDGLARLDSAAETPPALSGQLAAGQVSAWALRELVRHRAGDALEHEPELRMRLVARLGETNVAAAEAASRFSRQSSPSDLSVVAEKIDRFFAEYVHDPLAFDPDGRLLVSPDRREELLLPNLVAGKIEENK